MKKTISKHFLESESNLDDIIINYDVKGESYGNQKRNTLKLFKLNDLVINVKSFKIPNLVNQVVYSFFRKSKAQRSYEYANKLMALGIGTPSPIAYYEFKSGLLFKNSYYVSEQLDYKLTFRDIKNLDALEQEAILRAFTRFTYHLHENNILFLDHSPGNTLISKVGDDYQFFLVDLNRMKFMPLDYKTRIKNFSRLTTVKSMVEIMSDEYAKCIHEDFKTVFDLMWKSINAFQYKHTKRRDLKKKLKFWK